MSDKAKRAAAQAAVKLIEGGMRVGLGTGSTATHFVELLAERVKAEGLSLHYVPTSVQTETQARSLGLEISTITALGGLDIVVDGADEIDPSLRLLKGGGGALLREKIVAMASKNMVVIADEGKLVPSLGAFPLPVEIVQFEAETIAERVASVLGETGNGGEITRRKAEGKDFITDAGNYIYDCALGVVQNPEDLADKLSSIVGVVEHGLFLGLASQAIIGSDGGEVRRIG